MGEPIQSARGFMMQKADANGPFGSVTDAGVCSDGRSHTSESLIEPNEGL
jgi:hypothetical protein